MKFLLLLPLAILASCAGSVSPGRHPATAPIRVPPAAVSAEMVERPAAEASEAAAGAEAKIAELESSLKASRESATQFRARIDKERKSGLDVKTELAEVWKRLRASDKDLSIHIDIVARLRASAVKLRGALDNLKKAAAKASRAAAAKDAEAANLRRSLTAANAALDAAEADKAKLRDEVVVWRSKAAAAATYRHWAIAIGAVFVLLLVLRLVLSYFRIGSGVSAFDIFRKT